MIIAADAELAVGIESYGTSGEPCHGRVKTTADDFRVEEVISTDGFSTDRKPGCFPLYRVEKRSIDTMHMAREISFDLKSRISYGGLKDSRASAVQYVTPTSTRSAAPASIVRGRFNATLVGYLPRPLSRASVLGNRFEVIIRECSEDVGARVTEAVECAKGGKVPNYYGHQRFGVGGPGTHRIGKAIIMREFETAVRVLLGESADGSPLPRGKDVESMVVRELEKHPGEWVRALRAVPLKLRRLYVQAYQSFVFNRTLSRAMAKGIDISAVQEGDNWAEASADGLLTSRVRGVREKPTGDAVPMMQVVGYAHRDYGSRFDSCLAEVLESERVSASQFYVQEMQEVSSEGAFRRPHLAMADASWDVDEGAVSLKFTLSRGEYATVLLREILKPRDPAQAGLA
ncbi:MAG: tRNA pseudouridine(13) synthase TruD [Thaumarchaeota archaeon]|nr:tRNA pseudouridine(13) synthase TruD [Nitrososphaerota archaeon]